MATQTPLDVSTKEQSSAFHRLLLLIVGMMLVIYGILLLSPASLAQSGYYNDEGIVEAARILLTYMRGSFGALVMIIAGISAIVGAAFGSYRAALGLLIVALLAFTLTSFISTFFDAENIVNAP